MTFEPASCSGRLRVVPEPGEFGGDTWQKDSYAYSGAAGVWGFLGADDELGYIYLGTETPSSRGGDFWGGRRPGNNLFAESLICLDSRTGKRVWHFQAVHHGIWDYDFNAPPTLIDISANGRRIKAIAEVSKQAFVYVLDRATGEPVWPIEERRVPKGNVPGEWYAPTQPFPTKPPALDQQGATVDDLIDFTPELRQEALAILKQYQYGPLFTPPSVAGGVAKTKGTVQMPGAAGGSNWTGAAGDPETGVLYVTSVHAPFIAEMISAKDPEAARGNAPTGPSAAFVEWATRRGAGVTGPWLEGPRGLPIFKPPYGRLVAIDLNSGEIRWTAANGNGPRDHPAIKHLNLPPLGQGGRVSPLVTRTHGLPRRRRQRRRRRAATVGRRQDVPRVRQGHGTRDLGNGAPGGHNRRADVLHVRGQAVHRRRDRLEEHGWRARRAVPALMWTDCRLTIASYCASATVRSLRDRFAS